MGSRYKRWRLSIAQETKQGHRISIVQYKKANYMQIDKVAYLIEPLICWRRASASAS